MLGNIDTGFFVNQDSTAMINKKGSFYRSNQVPIFFNSVNVILVGKFNRSGLCGFSDPALFADELKPQF
jgi:hypothetical protein